MEDKLEIKNWLISGKFRIPVLRNLVQGSKTPSQLAANLEINRASISRILRGLKEKKLIDWTKQSAKTKLCYLTPEGKKALNILNDFKNNGKGDV